VRLPPHECERIFAGEVTLKVWREFRGLEQSQLREQSGIRVDIIDRIERGVRKATKPEALMLAGALDVAIHNLYPHHRAYSGCSAVDVDEDDILARDEAEGLPAR
jgi:transcriptional regulator with XRE-family HTH domain